MIRRTAYLFLLSGLLTFWCRGSSLDSADMRITILGTGTPYADSQRYGSAVLVEAAGKKLLFDCGRGTVIRLSEIGVNASEIDTLFLTHLHSDHVVGLPDLWLTGWFLGRSKPLEIWGPLGTRNLTRHLAQAFSFDVQSRTAPPESLPVDGAKINTYEVKEGRIYDSGGIQVIAFTVDHGTVKPAFGYLVVHAGHSVVISGDTRFSQNLVKFAKGTDCLIHVAWAAEPKNSTPPAQRSLASAMDAARVFELVKPRLAVIYHYRDDTGIAEQIRYSYSGPFVIAKDKMSIVVGSVITWTNGTLSGSVK